MTLDDLEPWFAHQILGRYHQTVHRGLGCTPLAAWLEQTREQSVDYPADMRSFSLDLLPGVTRTITRQGIRLFNMHYSSAEVGYAFVAGQRSVEVKYDPRDLSKIYAKLPRSYVDVPSRLPLLGAPKTLALYKLARRERSEANSRLDPMTVQHAMQRAEEVIGAASKRSVAAARQQERLLHSRTGRGLLGTHNAPEFIEKDWDAVLGDDE